MIKHGHTRRGKWTAEYQAWCSMRGRCCCPTNRGFSDYGGRGIKICERWLASFEAFYEDMGKRPSRRHSLNRIDNDGNYEPENCEWALPVTQSNNTRWNRLVECNGITETFAQLSRKCGIQYETLRYRIVIKGMSAEKAIALGKGRAMNPVIGDKHPRTKLADDDVRSIRREMRHGARATELAVQYGVTIRTITRIVSGIRRQHVTELE